MMNKYEIMVIVKPNVEVDARAQLSESLKGIITKDNGTIDNVADWGLREFAYEIQDFKKGYYTVLDVTAPAVAIAEFDRLARINANVLGHMTIRK